MASVIIKVIDDEEVGDEGASSKHRKNRRLNIVSKGFTGFMMSLFKAKTGANVHVNYWGIIN